MKNFLTCAFLTICLALSCNQVSAQENTQVNKEYPLVVETARYLALKSADPNYILKLDTRTGQIYPIQLNFSARRSIEKTPSYAPLVAEREYVNGRFALYRTDNPNTFLLLDQITGNAWHYKYKFSTDTVFLAPVEKE